MNDARLKGLYVLTDERRGGDLLEAVAAALAGGAVIVQYRDKSAAARRIAEARQLRELTRRHGAVFIVNDDPWLAAESGADGVHLGRDDPDIAAARELLGGRAIIGVSCYDSLELGRGAVAEGANYVAFGSVYPSPTKPAAVRASLELFAAAKYELGVPICAIGGITPGNVGPVVAAGADMVAVISAVFSAPDIEQAASEFADIAPNRSSS